MLIIRNAQMEVFREYAFERYEEKLVNYLWHHLAEARTIPREELEVFVHEQVTKARFYQFSTERQIAVYVTTAWLLGGEFDVKFWQASDQLNSAELSADEKIEWLVPWAKDKLKVIRGRR
jgi:hypothetical protein